MIQKGNLHESTNRVTSPKNLPRRRQETAQYIIGEDKVVLGRLRNKVRNRKEIKEKKNEPQGSD